MRSLPYELVTEIQSKVSFFELIKTLPEIVIERIIKKLDPGFGSILYNFNYPVTRIEAIWFFEDWSITNEQRAKALTIGLGYTQILEIGCLESKRLNQNESYVTDVVDGRLLDVIQFFKPRNKLILSYLECPKKSVPEKYREGARKFLRGLGRYNTIMR